MLSFYIIYIMYSIMLYLWTSVSVNHDSSVPKLEYAAAVGLLAVFVLAVMLIDRKKRCFKGIAIAAVFMNIGLSISYRMWKRGKNGETPHLSYVEDMVLMLIVFLAVYLMIRFTRIYRLKFWNVIVICFLPICIYGARVTGSKVYGSYLYFAGFMIFGLALMGFPFVAAYFVTQKEDRYLGLTPNVRNLPLNLTELLIYTLVLYGGCVLCNEFGLLLIIGLSTTIIFLIRCKNGFTKALYSLVCIGAALLASLIKQHIADRAAIWLHPSAAVYDEVLKEKAESVLYVFRHIYRMGWWGNGIGNLPRAFYPTLNTDHVIITMLNDYSVWIVIFVLILAILFVKWMLTLPNELCTYDQYLNLTCGLVFGFIILVNVASNLGSFITAGIGFPWISEGSSVNIMLTALLAIHCGLIGKKEK